MLIVKMVNSLYSFNVEDRNNNNHKNAPATILFKDTVISFLLHVLDTRDTRLFVFWTSVLPH